MKAQQQISSGKRVSAPSDDPTAITDILRIKGDQSESAQYVRNLTFAKSRLQTTEGVIDSVEQLAERVRTLGLSSFGSPTSGDAYAFEVRSLRDQMISTANTTHAGRYIFGGANNSQIPYVKNPDTTVSYNGNSEDMFLQVNRSSSVQIQVSGDTVFSGPVNIFDVMGDLATAIESGDKDGITQQTQKVEQFLDVAHTFRTKIGSYLNQMTTVESDLSTMNLARESQLSREEAADLAAAISELTMSQNAVQATLAVTAKVSQLSLLDYLK